MDMMREEGTAIGRFKVSRLMEELGLVCKQPGKHAYKQATVERVDIPNHLNREFTVEAPIRSGAAISPMFGRRGDGITWLWCWICSLAEPWAGHSRYGPTPTLLCKRWKWPSSSAVDRRDCCSIRIREVSTLAENSVNDCGAIEYGRV